MNILSLCWAKQNGNYYIILGYIYGGYIREEDTIQKPYRSYLPVECQQVAGAQAGLPQFSLLGLVLKVLVSSPCIGPKTEIIGV